MEGFGQTETTLTTDGHWSISISEDGIATLRVDRGFDNNGNPRTDRDVLKYNGNAFSCYQAEQEESVKIYRCNHTTDDYTMWDVKEHKDPCVVAGYTTYICPNCQREETVVIPATGEHNYKNEEIVPATCTTAGYTIHSCDCGDSYKDTYFVATHNFVDGRCSCGVEEGKTMETATYVFSNYPAGSKDTSINVGEEHLLAEDAKLTISTNCYFATKELRIFKNGITEFNFTEAVATIIITAYDYRPDDAFNALDVRVSTDGINWSDWQTKTISGVEYADYTFTFESANYVQIRSAYTYVSQITINPA